MKYSKDEILEKLRKATKIKNLKLPEKVEVKSEADNLIIKLSKEGLVGNMQADASAFEGWAIAIKAICPEIANQVEIQWVSPEGCSKIEKRHYNRFLYRVIRFHDNFPDWVKIRPLSDAAQEEMRSIAKELENREWVLNYPNCEASEHAEKEEAQLERLLLKVLPGTYNNQQLPMGLFYKEKKGKTDNERTPRSGSQIDLWSIDNNVFTVYELKKSDNKKIGIISELMFYVNIVTDLKDKKIEFSAEASSCVYRSFDSVWTAFNTNSITKVVGVFLANKLHPAIEAVNTRLLSILNSNSRGIEFVCMGYETSDLKLLKKS